MFASAVPHGVKAMASPSRGLVRSSSLLRTSLAALPLMLAAGHAQAVNCTGVAVWNSATAYTSGQQVQESGKAYSANWWTQGQSPAANSGAWAVWKLLGSCDGGGGGTDPANKPPVAAFTSSVDRLNLSLDASASTDPDGQISSYQWSFGDGSSASGAKVTHAYAASGTYAVSLTVTDNKGASNAKSQSFTLAVVVKDPATGKYILKQSDVLATEARLTDTALFRAVKASIATRDNATVATVAPGLASNPENVKRVEKLLPASRWEYLFPLRDKSYTYTGLLQAIAKFSGVCMSYTDGRDSDAICRKTLATMFAHFTA